MPVRDELGKRMKTFYEEIPKTKLMRRTPVMIRIDAKAFHTFTRGFNKPFDGVLMKAMQETMKYLCKNIQGCVFGYTQSDEITLVLVDYQTLTTSAWFDYEVQKICSIAASMATMVFNKEFNKAVNEFDKGIEKLRTERKFDDFYKNVNLLEVYYKALNNGAMFDARCFNVPKEEVTNFVYWRQLDATRNSIQMVGQANFSHRELQGKSCNQIQDMLHEQKDINWNDFPISQKRGSACIKRDGEWVVDLEMPILKGEDREYVDKLIYI